ncbi:MAG TPA: histidine kinase, partial [Candidatus Angelobacter sp.]
MTEQRRGKLKVFMGYAAGVGKTYKMLEEAQALKAQGKDVAIAYFESHHRPDTIAKASGLEVVPRKQIIHDGVVYEEMDTDAILARHPQICVVDELRHTNVPGSKRQKRWEDVLVLLDAGIDVLTTLDIQYLESLNDEVRHITGIEVQETVPDWLIHGA